MSQTEVMAFSSFHKLQMLTNSEHIKVSIPNNFLVIFTLHTTKFTACGFNEQGTDK